MENSEKIKLTIDGIPAEVEPGTSVLEAARSVGVRIPTLCYLRDINEIGSCRMCVVDVGGRALQAACVLPVSPGMTVKTNTREIRQTRKDNLKLLLSTHDKKCLSCIRSQNCELQQLCRELGVEDADQYEGERITYDVDDVSTSIVRDNNKCINCRRCVSTCENVQNVAVIGAVGRGFKTKIASPWEHSLADTACINCGQCIVNCPVGALREKDETDAVWSYISDPELHVVVQPAPAVRVAIGEEFGMPMGSRVTGKLAAALRRIGFDRVFDTDFGADLTIVEEANELLHRLKHGGALPLITSCSPGWIKYAETFYPEFLPNLSTCKSPHMMAGALIKSYYAEHAGIDPAKIRVVSVMPCTAKKYEAKRPEMNANGFPDVDAVITTRELARMLKEAGIEFEKLPDEGFDPLMGESTGAGAIFGATGGVMEAALRTAYETVTGKSLERVEFTSVRGLEGIKEATIRIGDIDVNVAVAHSTGMAAKLLDMIKRGEKNLHFIEIMGCPGGCVTGGGQPIVPAWVKSQVNPAQVRARGLYDEDEAKAIRKAHENPEIKRLYSEFLGAPNGHKAHELLHTHYHQRDRY